jgi:uncharacterized protein (DUF433 family)
MEKEFQDRIVINPAIMAGKPIIKGTRIPVDMVADLFAQGMSFEDILEDYPHLKKEDLRAVLIYLADLVRGETAYEINLEDA